MLFKILFLSCLVFAAIYPLCFWISSRDPLKNNFHRFHLGISCVIAGLSAIFGWVLPSLGELQYELLLWAALLFMVTAYYWKKEHPEPLVLTMISLAGMGVVIKFLGLWMPVDGTVITSVVLGGVVFCSALFAMNLGHWYLNVHGLPLTHLKRAVYMFWGSVAVRAVFDLSVFANHRFLWHGETTSLTNFIMTIDGSLIGLAILFGTIFPLVTLYFVKGTLDAKSTQSATGILYAVLCGVIIADITTKYYLFKFNIPL